MKLKNKRTGEIVEFRYLQSDYVAPLVLTTYENDKPEMYSYNSLAELNTDWEDYEEPKEYWYYDTTKNGVDKITHLEDKEKDQAIGNYFETKEEAEKAVEKLKAWKRLKDKAFRFNGWEDSPAEDDFDMIWFTMKAKVWDVETQEALDLLFGGEE